MKTLHQLLWLLISVWLISIPLVAPDEEANDAKPEETGGDTDGKPAEGKDSNSTDTATGGGGDVGGGGGGGGGGGAAAGSSESNITKTGIAEVNPKDACNPGTPSSIKNNFVRILILCYVYGCEEEVTSELSRVFNIFHHITVHPDIFSSANETEIKPNTLNDMAQKTSALEKDRVAALMACTDWMSLLNKLLIDITGSDQSCFIDPSEKYPSDENLSEMSCDEMVTYLKQLHRHYDKQCKDGSCDEKKKAAVQWFHRAYKQLGKNCYYDAYDYLDSP
ncbi:uncharacterized protein LOC129743619 [Uranotaenia lowii]|uniref:uncharacterized protein LOC129743619 n=1 Tax=Uranotaenia lowii TaxID=190385 RepID=UPI00247AD728|nr:uncharacterized protein LOC129743619 [Uranotaenia lowii]